MKGKLLLLTAVLCASVLFIGSHQVGWVNAGQDQMQPAVDDSPIWTKWDADHYTLADDGESIWLGTASGLIRWNKAGGTYTRYATPDGLPQYDVLAIAVDGQGNRWFGGDGGLSHLDTAEKWTTYNTANSGIHGNIVNGIAVAAGGTIWLSHYDGPEISQLNPDGTWLVHADHKTAVTSTYAAIKQTINTNPLWTVSGNDVWIGYEKYDGSSWQTLAPPAVGGSPLVVAADSKGKIWFLTSYYVYAWNGVDWSEYPFFYNFDGFLNTLSVGQDDQVWVGWQERDGNPYTNHAAGISRVPDTAGYIDLDQSLGTPPPVAALLPATEGLWGAGPNWLLLPDGTTVRFIDEPYFKDVNAVVVDRQGRTWLHSSYYGPYTGGVMQTLDDKGTATLADDQGELRGWASIVNVLEPAANGDLWIAGESDWRVRTPLGPRRYFGDDVVDYWPPFNAYIDDIYVEDNGRAWFAVSAAGSRGLYSLDDHGTPYIAGDDIWDWYPISTPGTPVQVAVQEDRIWYGDNSGLFLHKESGWEQVNTVKVTSLVPAADGTLFVGMGSFVLIVAADGQQSLQSIEELIANDLALVRSTQRRNRLWTVALDGGVWFRKGSGQLARRDESGEQVYQTAVFSDYIEVDQYNHVWLANGALLRMSPRPDFTLEIHPHLWLMTPNDVHTGTIATSTIAGFNETVTLAVGGLPAGVTATIDPNPLLPGEKATLTLTAIAAPLGNHDLLLSGKASFAAHEQPFRLAIVQQVYDMLLPMVPR